jgi:peptidyl-prolyl cis-trans isomerase D
MLLQIRDRATGLFAYIILFLISVPFALWGIQSYFTPGGQSLVAEVNGEEIAVRTFQNSYQQQRQRLTEMFGGKLPEGLMSEELLKSQTLNLLLRDTLIRQEVAAAGYYIGDEQLAREIRQLEVFQNNGKFDPVLYQRLLDRQRLSKAGFEQQMRASLIQDQFRQGIVRSSLEIDQQYEDYKRLFNQLRDFDYITLAADSFRESAMPDEAAIKAYYDNNLSQFMSQDRVRAAYVVLSMDEVAAGVPVSEEEVRQYYDEQPELFRTVESRVLSHILIKTGPGRDQAAAIDMAQSIADRIKSGESFADIAKIASEDRFSAEKGGKLGELAPGEMGDQFDQVAFSLAPGEVSNPVVTERGVELIRADEVTASRQKSFEEAKTQILNELRQREAERSFLDLAEKLGTLSYEVPDNLEEAADAIGVRIQESGWFTIDDGTGIAADQRIRNLAFTEEVLNKGMNSEMLELSDTEVLVLRVLEHDPSQQRPLAEVRDVIINILATRNMKRMASKQGQELLASVQEQGNWDAIASEAPMETVNRSNRRNPAVDSGLLGHVFSMNHPDSAPVFSGYIHPSGDYILVRLNTVGDKIADLESPPGLTVEQARREENAITGALKERSEIILYQDNI